MGDLEISMGLVSPDTTSTRALDRGTPATRALPELPLSSTGGLDSTRRGFLRDAALALVAPAIVGSGTSEVRADPVRINTDGTVTYKTNAAARTQPTTVQAVAADVSRVEPVTGPDGRTQIGVRVTFVRAGTTDVLGTVTTNNGPISYWGARGAAHTIDPTRIRVGDNFAVGVERRDPTDATKVTGVTGTIFKPASFSPNPRQ